MRYEHTSIARAYKGPPTLFMILEGGERERERERERKKEERGGGGGSHTGANTHGRKKEEGYTYGTPGQQKPRKNRNSIVISVSGAADTLPGAITVS